MNALAAAVAALVAMSLSGAPEVDVDDLLTSPQSFDHEAMGEIVLIGELVGDFHRRGPWVWAQLNDDEYVDRPLREGGALAGSNSGVGVRFATAEFDAAGLEHPGGYRFRGPVVRVTGEWRYHDEARGGESYLAVTSLALVERERLLHDDMPAGVLILGLALLALGGGLAVARRR
jgi:hypothetical protein